MKLAPLALLGLVVYALIALFGWKNRAPAVFSKVEDYTSSRQQHIGAISIVPSLTGTVGGKPAQWYVLDRTAPTDKTPQLSLDILVNEGPNLYRAVGGAPQGYSGPSVDDVRKSVTSANADVVLVPAPGSEFGSVLILGLVVVVATYFAISGLFAILVARAFSLVAGVSLCFLMDVLAHQQSDYGQRLVVLAGLYITLAVSLNLINGITGQFSIGHAAFYQIGAYLSGFITLTFFRGIPIPPVVWLMLMMIVGAIGAGLAGFLVGLPSLRLRGDYLAIVTMGFGEIIRIEVQNTPSLGGAYGMNVTPKIQPIWMVWLLAIFCIAVCRNLIRTAHGLPFLAVREDEVASAAMGVNVTRIKVTAFVLGSMFAGAAGALLTHYEGFITGAYFSMDISFIILTMVVLGGTGSITGSAVAAAFLSYLPEQLRGLKGPDGTTLVVTGSSVAAALIAVVIAVAIIKRVMDHGNQPKVVKGFIYIGALAVAIGAKVLVQMGLAKLPGLEGIRIEAGQLRMVVFAVTLIVLMLLRPEGIFGHHEFSWNWMKKVFGLAKKEDSADPTPAVAA